MWECDGEWLCKKCGVEVVSGVLMGGGMGGVGGV